MITKLLRLFCIGCFLLVNTQPSLNLPLHAAGTAQDPKGEHQAALVHSVHPDGIENFEPYAFTHRTDLSRCTPQGVIEGQVINAETNEPFGGARVYAYALHATDSSEVAMYETNDNGLYHLTVGPGPHLLFFTPPHNKLYSMTWYGNKPLRSMATAVDVPAGATITNINAALERGGIITGVITAVDNKKLPSNLFVTVYDADGEAIGNAVVDATGHYTTTALPTGAYRLAFSTYEPNEYLSEFFNDKLELASATSIQLTAPNDTPNINVVLARGGRVIGKVTVAESGKGLNGIKVTVYNLGFSLSRTATTDSSGVYTVTGLPTDRYKIIFDPTSLNTFNLPNYASTWYNGKASPITADGVDVSAPNDTVNINMALAKGGKITGRVTAADTGQSLEDLFVKVNPTLQGTVRSTRPDSSGYYTVTGIPSGSYHIEFSPFLFDGDTTGYASQWYNHKLTAPLADQVLVTAPNVTANINAALEPGGLICGRITAADTGFGLDQALVRAYDGSGNLVRSGSVDSYGYYVIPTLPPGAYKLYAFVGGEYAGEWYRDKPSSALAEPVPVVVRQLTSNINFVLTQAEKIYLPVVRR